MWCPNDKNDFLNNNTGQITPDNSVGKTLIKYVKENDLMTPSMSSLLFLMKKHEKCEIMMTLKFLRFSQIFKNWSSHGC
jgi:hypothetical protein